MAAVRMATFSDVTCLVPHPSNPPVSALKADRIMLSYMLWDPEAKGRACQRAPSAIAGDLGADQISPIQNRLFADTGLNPLQNTALAKDP